MSALESLLKKLEEKANTATPGDWVWAKWTILASDRETQKRREPYWTLIESPQASLCVGPLGRKSMDIETVIHGCGYEESQIDGKSEDMDYIAAVNPDTIKKLIAVIREQQKLHSLLKEASEWLCSHESAKRDFLRMNAEKNNIRIYRAWCCDCQNYIRSENDVTLSDRIEQTLKDCEKIVSGE